MVSAALSDENWKLTAPKVAIDAADRARIVLPIDFSLSNSEFARHGNDLMIRSLDGVVIAVRGYFDRGSYPKLVEYANPENSVSPEFDSQGPGQSNGTDPASNDEVFVYQSGDGKIHINDFDFGDVIRFEGFNSADILINNVGKNVVLTIVGEKGDSITLNQPYETDTDSYSITQTDDDSVIVTLDNQ